MTSCPHDTPEAYVAHAGIDRLWSARGWSVALTVAVRAQERTALDHLPRYPELRLGRVIAIRLTTGLAGTRFGIPVGRPFPHIAGHVEKAVTVGREAAHRCGAPVAGVGAPGEVAVPVVGQALARLRGLVAPGVGRSIKATAGRGLPFRLGRQGAPGPRRIGQPVVITDVNHRMVGPLGNRGTRPHRVAPRRPGRPHPPLAQMAEVDRATGPP